MKRPRRRPAGQVREAAATYAPEPSRRLLLDTHAWIWWTSADERLGRNARAAIRTAGEVYFSVASAWEIMIKARLKKLELATATDLEANLASDGFLPLKIELRHALATATLPAIHKDPFDRMLVSQAIEEGLTIVTSDAAIARYSVPVIDARA